MVLSFCGSSNGPFWDPNLTWYTNEPKFSECLQDTLPLWLPCGLFWLLFPIEVVQLRNLGLTKCTWRLRDYVFMSILTCAVVVRIVGKSILWSNGVSDWFVVGLISYTALFFTIVKLSSSAGQISASHYLCFFFKVAITYTTYLRQLKVYTGSGASWLTLMALCICGALEFGTTVQFIINKVSTTFTVSDIFNSVAYFTYFVLLIINLICLSFSSMRNDYQPLRNEDEQPPWPEEFCSFPNQLFYWWFRSLVRTGYSRTLERNDIWFIHNDDQCNTICSYFAKAVDSEYAPVIEAKKYCPPSGVNGEPKVTFKKKSPSLLKVLVKCFGLKIAAACLMMTGYVLLSLAEPLFVGLITSYAQNIATESFWHGYVYVAILTLALLIRVFLDQQSLFGVIRSGARIRSGLMSVIYQKALRLSPEAKKSSTVGEIVNLMSVDAARFRDITMNLQDIFAAPIQLGLGYYYLYRVVGVAAFSGIGVAIIILLLNFFLARIFEKWENAEMELKDERLKIMSEVINGMKVIKLYAWELAFENKVEDIRKNELVYRRKSSYVGGFFEVAWHCTVLLSSFATFATYVLINPDKTLTPEIIFVSLTIFDMINFSTQVLPQAIVLFIMAKVSYNRVDNYLSGQELEPLQCEPKDSTMNDVELHSANFAWETSNDSDPILKDINVLVPKGKLIAVIGKVGCGKSSLLSALCGEMFCVNGTFNVQGTIAYVPQQAWIQNMTLKDNILFNKDYDDSLYSSVLDCCALRPDLEMLPGGDLTEIGERGINLSGGQKMRVGLARAVYQELDLYLLDDPFAAVDVHVGKQIFEQVIGPKGLLRTKTRILVTHGLTYLPHCDLILIMKDGQIDKMGTFQELVNEPGSFSEIIQQHFQDATDQELEDEINDEDLVQLTKDLSLKEALVRRRASRQTSVTRTSAHSSDVLDSVIERLLSVTSDGSVKDKKPTIDIENDRSRLIDEEVVKTGQVSWTVYWTYAKAAGFGLLLYAFCVASSEIFQMLSTFWLQTWSDNSHQFSINATEYKISAEIGLRNYGLLGLGQTLFVSMLGFCFAAFQVRAAKNMHKKLLQSLLRAPMSFFDTTPTGRIVNRCGRDIDTIDESVPGVFNQFWHFVFQTIRNVVAIFLATPYFAVALVPVLIGFFFAQRYYVRTSRQLRRLEAVSRSPIYSHFQESLQGVSTIRAYRRQSEFIRQSEHLIDVNTSADLVKMLANRWVAVYMDLGGHLLASAVGLIVVIMVQNGMTAGLAGLALSYAVGLCGNLMWGVRITGILETEMVAVERVSEYAKTKPEAPWKCDSQIVPNEWPSYGEVNFVNYSTRYRPGLPPVLQTLSFSIPSGAKVGVVGRTGAGKSSMTLALFRIIESVGGQICIDGLDISQMGLHDLRRKLTIIPQDPVLFSGTLRANIDPLNEFGDADVWRVLELSHLKSFVATLPEQLQHDISEGGTNLSVGQRQLICLSRALLRKTKILALDEATASVDVETDSLIQLTIREQFKECTVITIAHRLNTIMDNDKILVLEEGKLVEFDSPTNLLQKKDSLFSKMTQEDTKIR